MINLNWTEKSFVNYKIPNNNHSFKKLRSFNTKSSNRNGNKSNKFFQIKFRKYNPSQIIKNHIKNINIFKKSDKLINLRNNIKKQNKMVFQNYYKKKFNFNKRDFIKLLNNKLYNNFKIKVGNLKKFNMNTNIDSFHNNNFLGKPSKYFFKFI